MVKRQPTVKLSAYSCSTNRASLQNRQLFLVARDIPGISPSLRMRPKVKTKERQKQKMANASKKPRKANFSHSETLALLEGILEKKDVLMCSLGSDLTNRDKCNAWRVIAEKVSSIGAITRAPAEVREKFYNLKRDHRARASARKKTGNGGVAVKPYDELIELIVGKDSELVDGVKGVGHDHDVFKASQFSIISGSDVLHVDNCSSNTTVLASNNMTLMEVYPKSNREQGMTPENGCTQPGRQDYPVSIPLSIPEVLPSGTLIVKVHHPSELPLDDDSEVQTAALPPPSHAASVEHPQQLRQDKTKTMKETNKDDRPLKKKLKTKQRADNDNDNETPIMTEYLKSFISLNKCQSELIKLQAEYVKEKTAYIKLNKQKLEKEMNISSGSKNKN